MFNKLKEAEERLKTIDNLLLTLTDKKFPEEIKKCINSININYSNSLELLANIINDSDEKEKNKIYKRIVDKEISKTAIDSWEQVKDNFKSGFSLFNELIRNNIDNDSIQKLDELNYKGAFSDIKIDSISSDMKLTIPAKNSFNWTFAYIKQIFELVTGNKVTLQAKDDIKFEEKTLEKELVDDYNLNGKTTYPNIVKYLYSNHFKIIDGNSFKYKKIDYRLKFLLDILNNEEVFNPKLFSPHAKLRFLERFVLNEDFSPKSLYSATKYKVKHFIDSLRLEQQSGILINPYKSLGGYVGMHMVLPTTQMGDVEITLDDKCKIHTIF